MNVRHPWRDEHVCVSLLTSAYVSRALIVPYVVPRNDARSKSVARRTRSHVQFEESDLAYINVNRLRLRIKI